MFTLNAESARAEKRSSWLETLWAVLLPLTLVLSIAGPPAWLAYTQSWGAPGAGWAMLGFVPAFVVLLWDGIALSKKAKTPGFNAWNEI